MRAGGQIKVGRKLRIRFVRIAFSCALAGIVAAAIWSAGTNVTTISETTEIGLAEIPDYDWVYACFAPAYHILDSTKYDIGPSACWSGKEVPERWTYLTFYSKDGSCQRYRFQADFLIRHGADYRCFQKGEHEDIEITISDGVLRLQ